MIDQINNAIIELDISYFSISSYNGKDLVLQGAIDFDASPKIKITFESVYYMSILTDFHIDSLENKVTFFQLQGDENRSFSIKNDILQGYLNYKIQIDGFKHKILPAEVYISAETINYSLIN